MPDMLENASNFIGERGIDSLVGAISTGSGQTFPLEGIPVRFECGYGEIPGLGDSAVPGHSGVLRVVEGADGLWAVWVGRRHFYEGFDYEEIGFYIDISHALGARSLLCVNAAGGLDPELSVGDLVVVERYRSFVPSGDAPVSLDGGPWRETADRLVKRLAESAERCGVSLGAAAYVGVPGPTYETAAEVEWLRSLGCGLVGMSTVAELDRATELGMDACALSQVANVHGKGESVTHDEVVRMSERGAVRLGELMGAFLGTAAE